MPINAPEHGAIRDPGGFQPSFECDDGAPLRPPERHADGSARAVLIGLRLAQINDQPLPNTFDVTAVERDQFGSPERARKANQQQRPVSQVLDAIPRRLQHSEQIVPEQWSRLTALADFLRSLRMSRCAAARSRRLWTRTSSTKHVDRRRAKASASCL
jgi:hypothetical protein